MIPAQKAGVKAGRDEYAYGVITYSFCTFNKLYRKWGAGVMTQTSKPTFEGFEPSNGTIVPDVLFDELLAILSGAELKALLYIIRRTRGFKKDSDAISLNQFLHGIKTRDGKQLDKGCGVKDRTTLVSALTSLEQKGCIVSTKQHSDSGDMATTVYSIKFKKQPEKPVKKTRGSGKNLPPVVGKPDDGRYEKPTRGSGKNLPPVVGKPDSQLNSNTTNSIQQTVIQPRTPNVVNNPVVSGVALATPSQTTITSTLIDLPPLPEPPKQAETKKPRNTLKARLATVETFDFEQPVTIESIMQLGDCWRGSVLPVIKRADSDYQKAVNAATQLNQRPRQNGQHGYSLREIDRAYRYFKRIAPEGKPDLIADEWWKGKNVDVWVIAKNIDKALDAVQPNITILPEKKKNTSVTYDDMHAPIWGNLKVANK